MVSRDTLMDILVYRSKEYEQHMTSDLLGARRNLEKVATDYRTNKDAIKDARATLEATFSYLGNTSVTNIIAFFERDFRRIENGDFKIGPRHTNSSGEGVRNRENNNNRDNRRGNKDRDFSGGKYKSRYQSREQ